jgi:UDP-N-acetylmuramoyl-L-alanyl-D-glutamate--2,6-diaminopimelate ligase
MLVGRAGADVRIVRAAPEGPRQRLDLEILGKPFAVDLPLAGAFQADNAAIAAALAIAAGIEIDTVVGALAALKGAPGRLEKVAETEDGAAIFVDYAHKPEALSAALAALRPLATGRLVVVFGAGGDRDKGKRPLMAAAAKEQADIVIVTDDNPRSEDPGAIRAEILAGDPGAIEIAGRGKAIAEAVGMLRAGDVLCVAGKGHETGQTIAGKTLPFSDHQAVADAVAAL